MFPRKWWFRKEHLMHRKWLFLAKSINRNTPESNRSKRKWSWLSWSSALLFQPLLFASVLWTCLLSLLVLRNNPRFAANHNGPIFPSPPYTEFPWQPVQPPCYAPSRWAVLTERDALMSLSYCRRMCVLLCRALKVHLRKHKKFIILTDWHASPCIPIKKSFLLHCKFFLLLRLTVVGVSATIMIIIIINNNNNIFCII